jgi:transmembrane sensor
VLPQTRPLAIAASIVGVIALGFALTNHDRIVERMTSTYATDVGEQRSLTLPDGSVVQLNSRSKLRTQFETNARIVEMLEGEAVFTVAKDASRPFRVRTASSEIVAIGTAFNVKAARTRTVVTVLEGKVRVNERAETRTGRGPSVSVDPVELLPGDQLIIDDARAAIRITLPDPQIATSWTERRLVFDDTQLATVSEEFARHTTKRIVIEDDAIAQRRISGVFDATDPQSLVQFLATDPTLEVRASDDGWHIVRRQ